MSVQLNWPLHKLLRKLIKIFNGTDAIDGLTSGPVDIVDSTSARLRLFEAADATGNDYGQVQQSATNQLAIQVFTDDASAALIDINCRGVDGQNHFIRINRAADTSGSAGLQVFRADGTNTIDHLLYGGTSGSLVQLCRNGGGVVIGDATHAAGLEQIIVKNGDQFYTSDISLNDDTDLQFPVEANEKYAVLLIAHVVSPTAADLVYDFSVPSGASKAIGRNENDTNTGSQVYATSGAREILTISAVIEVGSTAGTVIFQHAQSGSNAGSTGLYEGSMMIVTRMT